MKNIYNSALLHNNTKIIEGLPPTNRFELDGCIGLRRNIITEGYYSELDSCDIIYCEPPFPTGIKVFDERAKEKTDYTDFCIKFALMWGEIKDKPKLAITNKRLLKYLPKPDMQISVILNKNLETLSCWGVELPNYRMSNLKWCEYLGQTYTRMGDITCGYGVPVLSFKKSRRGNTFVASDYDAHCITGLRMLMNENIS